MWRKAQALGALVAIGLLGQPAYASSVDIVGQATGGSETFLLTGYNSDSNAFGLLSLDFVNVGFPPLDDNQAFYNLTATVTSSSGALEFLPDPGASELIASANNGYAASACRYEVCTNSIAFSIPTGLLYIELTVTSDPGLGCYNFVTGECNLSLGTPVYELTLSVPDDLCLQATPLPASLPLFASGFGAFGALAWRRKRLTPPSRS
jgi:hypothetical protein